MVIVRQHVGDATLAHRVYRDAVGKTIAFVMARFVEGECRKERVRCVRHDFRIQVHHYRAHVSGGEVTCALARFGIEV